MMSDEQPISWFDKLWPRLAVASGVGYLAVSYGVSRWLTRRSPAKIELPGDLPHCTIEPLECRTTDGITLKGWHIAPPRPRATIALFHGMRLNRTHTLDRIAFLTEAGYRCIAFDHRAHGESGGRVCTFGFRESNDVVAVFDLIRSRWPDEPRAAVGVSMGAASICMASRIARGFDALVLESVYANLARAFEQRIGSGFPHWFHHFRNGIVWFSEYRLGALIEQVSPLAHVAQFAPRHVLFVTGSDDPHAPPQEVRSLALQLPNTSRFHVIPGAGHDNVCAQGGPDYRDLLLSFLDENLFHLQNRRAA